VRELVGRNRLARRIVAYAVVESTNDVARRLGQQGQDGVLVIAEQQTAGRGRRGRHWESASGRGLYLSVLLRPPQSVEHYAAGLQLALGVAIAETIATCSSRPPELVWPNDCMLDGRKAAGVLVESEASGGDLDFLVCGVGINVNQQAGDFSSAVRSTATSLAMSSGKSWDRGQLLARLISNLESWDDVLRGMGITPILRRWCELSPAVRDRAVQLETVAGTVRGHARGLSERGGLLVEQDGVVREIISGELIRVAR